MLMSAGQRFRDALKAENPLQIVGTINAYAALQAKASGFRALYLSGAGVANASYGLPDLGMTSLEDVLVDIRRITDAVELPLLVDIDTGFGSALSIARTIKSLIKAGAAACHIEDQIQAKRCGHRPNKALVSKVEMVDRIKAAVDARSDPNFVIMARTDAIANEHWDAVLERVDAYIAAGADMIFAEAVTDINDYRRFTACGVPVLANMTEFGRTPLYSVADLAAVGIQLILYPLSAFRAMANAADKVYQHIRQDSIQTACLDQMQNREALYETLDYHTYEKTLDRLFADDSKQ